MFENNTSGLKTGQTHFNITRCLYTVQSGKRCGLQVANHVSNNRELSLPLLSWVMCQSGTGTSLGWGDGSLGASGGFSFMEGLRGYRGRA